MKIIEDRNWIKHPIFSHMDHFFLTTSIYAVTFPKMCQNNVISKKSQNFQTTKYKMKKDTYINIEMK